jgi:hypothetical protein
VPEIGMEGYSREMLGLPPLEAPDEPSLVPSVSSPRLVP